MQNSLTFQHPLNFMAYRLNFQRFLHMSSWDVGGKRLVISKQGVATPNFIEGLAPFQAKLSFFLGRMQ